MFECVPRVWQISIHPRVCGAVVRAITDGEYTVTGPQLTGVRRYMGRTLVLDTGKAEIVIYERSQDWAHSPASASIRAVRSFSC